ncbi:MAG: GIY-YIG nuclease family protein [Ignavibacteria bacterium]|nr:GIY-YIG nuclease family protein [Ignavibacteria bacterium]
MNDNDLLEQSLDSMVFCAVDVETTGLNAISNRVIEIGMVKMQRGEIIDRFGSLVNPGCRIPPFITQLTGIDDDEVDGAPFFEEIIDQISDFMDGTILVGHNLQFDLGFLRQEYFRAGRERFVPITVCTLKIARRLFPFLKSRSLGPLAQHLRLHTDTLHRALEDAELTAHVLYKEIEILRQQENMSIARDVVNYQFGLKVPAVVQMAKPALVSSAATVPDAPGVYYFLNKKSQIVYIGKAKSLKQRLRSYVSPTVKGKQKKIVKNAETLRIQQTNTELTACLLESELIKLIDPKMNIQLKSYRDKYFLQVDNSHRFPIITIAKDFFFDGNDYFGLFLNKRKAEEIFDIINKIFALRECSEKEFKKGKTCFLHEIERCTGACENMDEEAYSSELTRVFEFMSGKNQFALDRLLKKMRKYSDELRFEKAQEVKELVQLVLAQIQKSSLLEEPVNRANVLFEVIYNNVQVDYILLVQGKVYVNNYILNADRNFDRALQEYFEGSMSVDQKPDAEDLEKTKTLLNWVIRNRHQVNVFYLKNYKTRMDLERRLSHSLKSKSNISEIVISLETVLE